MTDHIGEFAYAKFSSCCRGRLRQKEETMTERDFLLLLLVTGAMITDLRKGKIYNFWILPAFPAGIALRLIQGGIRGMPVFFLSVLLAFCLLYPIYLIGGIGAGDVKLFMAIAACLSPVSVFHCIIAAFLIGGFLSLLFLIKEKNLQGHIHFAVPVGFGVILFLGGFYS